MGAIFTNLKTKQQKDAHGFANFQFSFKELQAQDISLDIPVNPFRKIEFKPLEKECTDLNLKILFQIIK